MVLGRSLTPLSSQKVGPDALCTMKEADFVVGDKEKMLGDRLDKRMDDLDGRLRAVEHGQAKLEGLREAIAGRKDAA